jgi:hypothetical protein
MITEKKCITGQNFEKLNETKEHPPPVDDDTFLNLKEYCSLGDKTDLSEYIGKTAIRDNNSD